MHAEPFRRAKARSAHALWAALGVVVTLVLVFGGGGHPPPLIFVPLVIVIWGVGHCAIWGVAWLAAQGRRRARHNAATVPAWPHGLRIALLGTGAGAALGILQLVVTAYQGRFYPFPDATLWTAVMALWLAHASCLAGLLLRRPWSRALSVVLVFAWAILGVLQIIEHLARGYRIDIAGLVIMSGLVVIGIALGLHLALSNRVKSFLNP